MARVRIAASIASSHLGLRLLLESVFADDRCTIVPWDDAKLATVTSGWTRIDDSSAYLRTLTEAKSKGESLRVNGITGNGIALVVTKCPDCGPVSIYVDGKLAATQSTYAAKTEEHAVLPLVVFKQQLATIKITTASGKPVFIDCIAVRQQN